jgi:paraquat-inducible protein A
LFAATLANANPILTFDVVGDGQSGWIITGIEELYQQGYWPLAALVLFASILAPILYLAAIWYVSAACFAGVRLPFVRTALRSIVMLEPWNLVPVYTIATVVSVVKLRMLGTVEWQFGARWVLGMALCSLLASQAFDHHLVGEKLEFLGRR